METEFYKIAADLTGQTVDRLTPCRSGRNSRVFKVTCGDKIFALKSYPSQTADPRDRFGTETRALRFYEADANPHTPRLLALDASRGLALMEWIDGHPVNTPETGDIDQAIGFITRTHAAESKGGDTFGLAAEPCLCGEDLDMHLALRLERLSTVAQQEPELNGYLRNELQDILEKARSHAQSDLYSLRLPRHKQSLIPADFGFHNALKTDSGRMVYFDFEYFGWDDPVRLAADFLLHPDMALDEKCRARFHRGMIETFQADEEFEQRLLYLSPLYAIRWALILLNEFLPERWQARVFAGETASWGKMKAAQLEKSRIALNKAMACLATL